MWFYKISVPINNKNSKYGFLKLLLSPPVTFLIKNFRAIFLERRVEKKKTERPEKNFR